MPKLSIATLSTWVVLLSFNIWDFFFFFFPVMLSQNELITDGMFGLQWKMTEGLWWLMDLCACLFSRGSVYLLIP